MLECLILGDSIAVGTHLYKKECVAYAKGGINSWQFNRQNSGEFFSDNVIISLGSNDHKHINTRKELLALRNRIVAKGRVFWILPHGNLAASGVAIETIQSIVREIAIIHKDVVLEIKHISSDNIHPTGKGYKDLAQRSVI